MTILDIELVHFGKFHYKKVRFSQGLNVVYGNNEAGKSTIHAFIRCMLLGMETEAPEGKESMYDRFFPWEDHGGYGGKMRLELKGRVYRIERDFRKECPSMRLIDEETGKELDQPQVRLKELLDGLNETNYDNTISIEQLKSPADPELAGELEHFILNTSRTKNVSVDIDRARDRIRVRMQTLKKQYLADADSESRACEEELKRARKDYDSAREQQYRKERQYEELEQQLERGQRDSAEEMLAYERERDTRRRQYEAARKNWEQARSEKTSSGRGISTFLLLIFTGILAIAVGWIAMGKSGLEQQTAAIAAAGLSAVLALCLIGLAANAVFASRRRRQKEDQAQIREKIKAQFDESAAQFAACKKAAPPDRQESFDQMHRDLVALKQAVCEQTARAQEYRKACEKLEIRQQEIRLRVADNRSISEELEALEVAAETMDRVAARVQETFGNRLSRESGKILAAITDGKYSRVQISTESGIRLGSEETMYALRSVSRGTMEQVYLAIRVAASELLWQKSCMPFIFDDVFAYYDDGRLESAMKMLKECGHQVIIFSCNTREDRLLEK